MSTPAPAPAFGPRPRLRLAPSGRRMVVIVNPAASGFDERSVGAALRTLRGRYDLDVLRTDGRGHATELAREAAADGQELVAAVGGDGTVSEVAAGLSGTDSTLVCLPAGVTNVFARGVGTPRRLRDAAAELAAATSPHTRVFDLGTIDGRPFVASAGVGFPAALSSTADAAPDRKATLGQLHFAGVAARELYQRYLRRPPIMRLEVGGLETTGITVVAQNSHALTYFGPKAISTSRAAGLQTGSLALTLMRRATPRDVAGVVSRLVTGRDVTALAAVEGFDHVERAVIVSGDERPLPVDADGEYLGERHRVELGVLPGALRVLTPR